MIIAAPGGPVQFLHIFALIDVYDGLTKTAIHTIGAMAIGDDGRQ